MVKRSSIKAGEEELKAYYADLAAQNLWPLWTVKQSKEPKSKAVPYVWHWRDLRPLAMRAAELVGTKEATQAMEFAKGERVEWIIEDKANLILHRPSAPPSPVEVKKTKDRSSENSKS